MFAEIRREIRKIAPEWDYTPHDLRATYATRRLYTKSKVQGLPFRYVAHELMGVMGHENFSVTEKYIRYWENKEISKEHAMELNAISETSEAV
jgi:integrase